MNIPAILLQKYPASLTGDQTCPHKCFSGLVDGHKEIGCYQYEPCKVKRSVDGVPFDQDLVDKIRLAMGQPCYVDVPNFFESDLCCAIYQVAKQFNVYTSLRVESRVDAGLDCINIGELHEVPDNFETEQPCSWSALPKRVMQKSYCGGHVSLRTYAETTGLKEIWFGVETADDDLLEKYSKNITSSQSIEATKLAKKNKLMVGWYLIASALDTTASLRSTADMVAFCRPNSVYISVLGVTTDTHHAKGKENAKRLQAEIGKTRFNGNVYCEV